MSVRAEKVSAEIRRNLPGIFSRIKTLDLQGLVTVMRVETDKELKHAKVYVSVHGADAGEAIKSLSSNKWAIKKELAVVMRSMRSLPDLHFFTDDSLEYSQRINSIINKLNAEN